MQNLRTVMNSDIARVRAELAKHIEKITLTPSLVSVAKPLFWQKI
jgi:hypothetical protein